MRTLVQISDIHFGAEDPDVVAALGRELSHLPHDLLIVSGDFTQRARRSQFDDAMHFVNQLPGPRLMVPGNHDIPLWNAFYRFGRPLRKYKQAVTRDLRPTFEDEQVMVMGLNTARPFSWTWDGFWKDGRINSKQVAAVRDYFGSDDKRFKVLVTHHPFLPPPAQSKAGVELEDAPQPDLKYKRRIVHKSRRALEALEAVGAELLLAGHLHLNYAGDVRNHHESVRRGILSVQAGTATSYRRRGEPNAYNRITIETPAVDDVASPRVTVQVRTCEDGNAFGDGSRVVFDKVKDGWDRQVVHDRE